jgi:RNA-directed DNA polymerase
MMSPKENSTRCTEGRSRLKGISGKHGKVRTQGRVSLPAGLARVNEAARRSCKTQFTALLHHIDVAALMRSFRRQRRRASAGVDGITVEEYEHNLEENLRSLCDRFHSGRYRPQCVRRVNIPKPDRGYRPIGVPVLEDKIAQGAIAEALSAVYEVDFLGFSYGFRPGRSPHQALKALERAMITRKVNWVLDADIRSFFDSVDHEWLLDMIAHRIADPRILRLISRWLQAGILESGEWYETLEGTPQGAGISPLLANIFLHYVLDLWVAQWRSRHALGDVIIIRYADDILLGFESEREARMMLTYLKRRFFKFGLALNGRKTRLIEFGRFVAERRAKRGERRPETLDFLGFTHYCSHTKHGRFIVRRKTIGKRMIRKLKALRIEAKRRRHWLIGQQQKWLSSVLRGYYRYYGIPGNFRALSMFAFEVRKLWFRALRSRSQKSKMTWARFHEILKVFPLPNPRVTQPLCEWLA